MRLIFLDTETTGLTPKLGDRIVEIACVDLGAMSPTPIPDSLLAALETLK